MHQELKLLGLFIGVSLLLPGPQRTQVVVSIFPDFGLPGKREFSRNSQAFPGISREIYAPYDSSFSSIHLYHNLYTNTYLTSLGDDKAKVTRYVH